MSGDRVARTTWAAVALGFAGVLVMLRPGTGSIDAWAALPLLAAWLYAAGILVTRLRCAAGHPLVLGLVPNLGFVVVGIGASLGLHALDLSKRQVSVDRFLLGGWTELGASEWSALGVLAVAMLVGSIGAAVAHQSGPAPLVASFD